MTKKHVLIAVLIAIPCVVLAEITGMITLPGGSDGSVQYNSGGVFEGDSDMTFNGSTLTVTGLSAGRIVGSSISISGLTSGRVPFAGTSGMLQDDSDLTFSGSTLTATGITGTDLSFTNILGSNISSTFGVSGATGSFSGALTAATLDTGQGANELYDMNQNVQTSDGVTFATVDTGQGANELYDMNQNVQTGDSVVFAGITNSALTSGRFVLSTTGGLQADDADFSQNGTTATLTGVSATNASISGLITTGLTASRALVTGTASQLAASAVTSTELGYLSGVTSSIQTQINSIGATVAASQTEMETSTATNVYVSPGRQQYHPGVAKSWVVFQGTGTVTIMASWGVNSVTDNATGDYTINFSTPFSSVNYVCEGFAKEHNDTSNTTMRLTPAKQTLANTYAVGSYRVNTMVDGGTLVDATRAGVTCWGDQ